MLPHSSEQLDVQCMGLERRPNLNFGKGDVGQNCKSALRHGVGSLHSTGELIAYQFNRIRFQYLRSRIAATCFG